MSWIAVAAAVVSTGMQIGSQFTKGGARTGLQVGGSLIGLAGGFAGGAASGGGLFGGGGGGLTGPGTTGSAIGQFGSPGFFGAGGASFGSTIPTGFIGGSGGGAGGLIGSATRGLFSNLGQGQGAGPSGPAGPAGDSTRQAALSLLQAGTPVTTFGGAAQGGIGGLSGRRAPVTTTDFGGTANMPIFARSTGGSRTDPPQGSGLFGSPSRAAPASAPLPPPPIAPASPDIAPGAEGQFTVGGLSIPQIIALAVEGFAKGAQGQAPQGAAILAQTRGKAEDQLLKQQEAQRKAQIESRKLEIEELKFAQGELGFMREMATAGMLKDPKIRTAALKKTQNVASRLGLSNLSEEDVAAMIEQPEIGEAVTALIQGGVDGKLNVEAAIRVANSGPEGLKILLSIGNALLKQQGKDKKDRPPSVGANREAEAAAMFGKPFHELTQEQQQQVNAKVDRFSQQASELRDAASAAREASTNLKLTQFEAQQRNQKIDNEANMRKEFVKESKQFVEVKDAFDRVRVSAENPSPAGDISLIFAYMKMLDPESTVREGEAATVENARGVQESVRSMYNRLVQGEKLGSNQRQDFVRRSEKLFQTKQASQQTLVKDYRRIARAAGLDADQVIVRMEGLGFKKGVSKSGRDIVSFDGGATWEYDNAK